MELKIKKIEVSEDKYTNRGPRRQHWQGLRVFIWPEGETILENLENRKQRPYTLFKKLVIPKVIKHLGLKGNLKAHWSQYAGCTCPCSPGFHIVDRDPVFGASSPKGHYRTTVHVTVEEV